MKHNYIKTLLTFFIAVTVFASSCQKDNGTDGLTDGQADVTINMKGIGASTENNNSGLRSSTSAGKSVATPAVQRQVVKFNEQYNVTAILKEVTSAGAESALRASANRAETTATGTAYTVRVYDGATLVDEKTFTQGEGNAEKFALEGGKNYTFQAFAYGDASAEEGSADQDPLWWEKEVAIAAGSNTVDIVLEHKLTEVTVVFNAGAGREITAIHAGTLAPNHNYTFNEETGAVAFNSATAAASVSFAGQSAGQTWTSVPTTIAVEDTNEGVVTLTGVMINGIEGSISSGGWALRAGVQYRLELNLGDKKEEGIDVGGSMWSPGNLEYNPQTGEYGFGTDINSIGDYWFAGYTLPKVLPDPGNTNPNPSSGHNGALGDPCALVLPTGSWRLPTKAEFELLKNNTEPGGADNPGPVDWNPARWGSYYSGNAGPRGMFFGTQVHPGDDRDDYLFILAGGSYNDQNRIFSNNSKAFYLVTENNDGDVDHSFTFLDLDIHDGLGWGMAFTYNKTHAVQIRCVKN